MNTILTYKVVNVCVGLVYVENVNVFILNIKQKILKKLTITLSILRIIFPGI